MLMRRWQQPDFKDIAVERCVEKLDQNTGKVGSEYGMGMVDAEWLLDWSSGALNPGFRPLVDGYLSLNPDAREAADLFDRLGGELLSAADTVPLSPDAVQNTLDMQLGEPDLDDSAHPTLPGHTARADIAELPESMRACLTGQDSSLRWFRPSPWISISRLFPRQQTDDGLNAFLLRIAPGHSVPSHSHSGTEMTLVLQGGYSDCTGAAKRGDLIIHDQNIDHRPVADPGENCIVATAFDGPLRLTGRIGRLLQPIFGL